MAGTATATAKKAKPAATVAPAGTLTQDEINRFKIEEVAAPGRGGRGMDDEKIPFGKLGLATVRGKEIIGPSIFLTEEDNPVSSVAAARKRHKGFRFHTRQMSVDGVPGVRVWKEAISK